MKIFILTAVMAASVSLGAGEVVDGIAARVGADAILKSDVMNELHRMGEPNDSRYKEILEEMIDRKLIMRAAANSKMTMQEWIVENRVREIVKKAFDGDRNKLIESLGRQRVSYPEWYARLKEDMVIGAMRWQIVDKNVTASPAMMLKEYKNHSERYTAAHKVSFSVIMLKPEEKNRRVEIAVGLRSKSFEAFNPKTYTDVEKPEDQVAAPIVNELKRLKPGETSSWIEFNGWSFMVKKTSETQGSVRSFEDAYEEIEGNVKEDEARRIYKDWVKRMRSETFIKIY